MTALKQFLLGLMLFGAVTYFGGGGTWASFSAETSNNGTSVASGTLTMSDQVNNATACLSANGAASNNTNAACTAALTLTNVAPGVFGGTALLTLQNTGSIDGSKLSFFASSVNATLNAALTSTVVNTTSLTVTPLEGAVTSGDTIALAFGTHSQNFVASASALAGATSIAVTPQLANFLYPVATTVTDTTSNANANNTNCFDVKTTTAGALGATKGTDLNFNPPTGNPFCATTLIYLQETTGGKNYCWLGNGAAAASGLCTAPISVALTTALTLTPGLTTLAVAPLNGNVRSTDTITVSSGSHTQTFVAAAAAPYGATSITINSATPGFAYPIGSTVTDTTTLNTLNSDTSDTITNFDTAHGANTGKVFLPPVTANGTIDALAPVQLSHVGGANDTRTFILGVYVPAPTGSNQNQLQGLSSTFGVTWHLDQ
jgi:hypothetical protein